VGQLRGHTGKKRRYSVLARFKGNNTRRPLFSIFFCVCWHGTSSETKFSLENFRAAKLVVLVSDCKRQSSNSRGNIPPPPLTSFERFQPERACLVVSTVALCDAKPVWRLATRDPLRAAAVAVMATPTEGNDDGVNLFNIQQFH
jgi:hypothetical protein